MDHELPATLSWKAKRAKALIERLSRREIEVLHDLVDGRSNKTIAYKLGISQRTVGIYRANLIRKLGVSSSLEAVCIGAFAGLGRCGYLLRVSDFA